MNINLLFLKNLENVVKIFKNSKVMSRQMKTRNTITEITNIWRFFFYLKINIRVEMNEALLPKAHEKAQF
ncbi:CLUMA_CG003802, isoform A [Clunio marinus]|uniref:CLUMA_CG003802, isoform A n=1 Tax=Clunio marinus TaxID=568069 RepID=A0A1J1HRR8_9DIPT|nr:CLUMA_CG003802, isoform A [Clunio marinus]